MSDWLFGYGSLIWRPGFPPDAQVFGEVYGFDRRFYQGSPDHRGTAAFPGRVVTLLPAAATARVFGVALKIPLKDRATILAALEVREQAGYERLDVTLHPRDDTPPINAFTFVATAENANFLGEQPAAAMAERIGRAHGQSGPNRDYLLGLHASLREHSVVDPHVEELVAALAQFDAHSPT